jgi:tetratricopeptide (TPR) repeat protein
MSSCRSTSRLRALALATAALAAVACSSEEEIDPAQDILHGTIAYPFVDENQPIGREPPDDKFIIKSAVGGTEYVVQIPGGARDYDVQVPLADLGVATTDVATAAQKAGANPVQTDKEIVSSLPQLKKERPSDTALLDGAFGTGDAEGPRQAPSYTLGIARVNEHYKKRTYELALIEINNLLAFYPNSPQIHKMKGTVLLKMRNLPLAELAWIKALELAPADKALQRALERLQKRIVQQGKAKNINGPDKPYEIPQPLGTTPPKKEDALAH